MKMKRAEIMQTLRQYKEEHQQPYRIIALGVFGSVARGEAAGQSDVDVVVSLEKQDLFNLIGIQQELEERLHISVDVVSYREAMNPLLKKKIDKEAVYV